MEVNDYTKLLHGAGVQYINSNLIHLPNTAKSTEERALEQVCPPTKLNPNYLPNPKIRRSGQIQQPQQQQQQRGGRRGVDPSVLKHIYGR
jgi:hypothetical protein